MHSMALTCLKGGTECGDNWVKNRINSATAVKGLTPTFSRGTPRCHRSWQSDRLYLSYVN